MKDKHVVGLEIGIQNQTPGHTCQKGILQHLRSSETTIQPEQSKA